MWEYATGKKPFYNRSHDHSLMLDILEGERPEITKGTPENRPTVVKVLECLRKYLFREMIKLTETKRQEVIKSENCLIEEKNCKNHPESFYTSRRPFNKLIQQTNSLNLSLNEQDYI